MDRLLREQVKHIHQGVNSSANRLITREKQEANPFKLVCKEISDLFEAALDYDDVSLEALVQNQRSFNEAFEANAKTIYASHGYSHEKIAGETTAERAKSIATIKLAAYKVAADKFIVFHVLGNNSREGLMSILMEYQALLELAVKEMDELSFQTLLQHIIFINSSAGGKGTSINQIDGYAIPRLPETTILKKDELGELMPQTITISRDHDGCLQQFGSPEKIKIIIKRVLGEKPTAELHTKDEEQESFFAQELQVRHFSGGLFLGHSEAEINEKQLKQYLSSLQSMLSNSFSMSYAQYLMGYQPCIIREEESFNTGENCLNVAKILASRSPELMAKMLITHAQKSEQGARAATTVATQTCVEDRQAFHMCFYNNPDYIDAIQEMSLDQFILFSMNLLTEILVEQSYVIEHKYYHHPLPKDEKAFRLGLQLILDIYNAVEKTQHSLDTLTLSKARDLFKYILWPQVEVNLVPKAGTMHDDFLHQNFYEAAESVKAVIDLRPHGDPVGISLSKIGMMADPSKPGIVYIPSDEEITTNALSCI